jgi:uncharacterized membrane protein YqgA involved in biofilm formation
MLGTVLNALAIVLGTVVGLTRKQPMTGENQQFLKLLLGVAVIAVGLRLTCVSLWDGSLKSALWQLLLVVLAMMLGKWTGRLLHLQKFSNRLGQFARERITAAGSARPNGVSDGINVGAALFCAAPLGILGAVSEGLGGGWLLVLALPLLVKSVMDGLAAQGFVPMFGWGIGLSALPVFAFQGAVYVLVAQFALPWLAAHGLVSVVQATIGLLVFCVSLLIFEVKRIEVADYYPSLIWAPLLMYWLN